MSFCDKQHVGFLEVVLPVAGLGQCNGDMVTDTAIGRVQCGGMFGAICRPLQFCGDTMVVVCRHLLKKLALNRCIQCLQSAQF